MNTYPMKLELRIDWSELDLFGHVNNVAYFKYVQASRINYWDKMRMKRLYEETKIGTMLASTGCNFIKPLFYPGNIIIRASVDFIKNTSFGIHHQIINDKNEIAAEAQDIVVMFDFNKNEKVIIPDILRKKIEELEKRKY